jgi:hypothetical protein
VILWTTVSQFYDKFSSWMNGPFYKLNPEEVEADTNDAFRWVHSMQCLHCRCWVSEGLGRRLKRSGGTQRSRHILSHPAPPTFTSITSLYTLSIPVSLQAPVQAHEGVCGRQRCRAARGTPGRCGGGQGARAVLPGAGAERSLAGPGMH